MFYKDYTDAIVAEYHTKMNSGDLPPALLDPTPVNLRNQCLLTFNRRYHPKDAACLSNFFGVEKEEEFQAAIKKFDADKFKPLARFMKAETVKPNRKILELLAWLIDFEGRPFNSKKQYDIAEEDDGESLLKKRLDRISTTEEDPGTGKVEPKKETGDSDSKLDKRRKTMHRFVLIIALLLVVGSFSTWYHWQKTRWNKGCMVWSEDRYNAMECDSVPEGILPRPFDQRILDGQRKIMRTDTITHKHSGVFKRGDTIEVFTMGGRDPLNPTKHLKPLTDYIISKYFPDKTELKISRHESQ